MQTRQLAGSAYLIAVAAVILSLFNAAWADPLDQLAFRRVLPATGLNGVAYGQGRFVAGGVQGSFLTSSDGTNWVSVPSGRTASILQVVYGGGVFVAAASGAYVFQSPDGLHWTPRETGLVNPLRLTYGNGRFLGVASDGRVATSTNGLDWSTSTNSVTGRSLTAVAYGNGRFVAVGTSIWVSPDGVNWTAKNSGKSVTFLALAFGNGVFVTRNFADGQVWVSRDGESWAQEGAALGSGNIQFAGGMFISLSSETEWLSSDGAIWSRVTPNPGLSITPGGVAYGAGQYVAVGSSSVILVSSDAIRWSSISAPAGTQSRTLVYAEGRFLSVGQYPFANGGEGIQEPVLLSNDGVAWTGADTGVQANLSGVAYGDGRFVAVGAGYGAGNSGVGVSEDGESWSAFLLNLPLTQIAYGSSQFIAVGSQGISAATPDGYHWTKIESGTTNQLNGVSAVGDTVVAVGKKGTLLRMVGGLTWVAADSGTTLDLQSAAIGQGLIVVVGTAGTVRTSTDGGVTWLAPTLATTPTLRSVAYGNGLFVAVGDAGLILVSADGSHWRRLSTGSSFSLSAAAFGDGKFIVQGNSIELVSDLRPGILTGLVRGQNGLSFSILGEIGRVYRVQAASRLDLPDWSDLGAVTSSQLTVPFVDRNAGTSPTRFYRVVSE